MEQSLGQALAEYDGALERFGSLLGEDAALKKAVFADTDTWINLLRYKLVPHLAGEGCLVVAIMGGTNSGKSTVFNLLLGQETSPAKTTAAATRHPVLAANALRAEQCLGAKLVPEFEPRPLEDPDAALNPDLPAEVLLVTSVASLPDRLVLLDTPDVDSIDKENWSVAENIRAAGDVLVAVLTEEKYCTERVVEFFRRAHASGRVIVPLMNKANPADGFDVARLQLREFCSLAGLQGPCFVLPHDFALMNDFNRPIPPLEGVTQGEGMTQGAGDRSSPPLRKHLESLDVPAIKERVYRDTIRHFADQAGAFHDHAQGVGQSLRSVVDEFESRTKAHAGDYDPVPNTNIGGLFHEFVQAKRGPVRRFIGSASSAMFRGTAALAKTISGALGKRAAMNPRPPAESDEQIRASQVEELQRIARSLAAGYIESSHNLREPAAHLLASTIQDLDIEAAAVAAANQTLRSESISDEFREHALKVLDGWWNDHKGKRRILETLDTSLAVAPAAIAVPMSVLTGGWGVPETVLVMGGLAEQLLARGIEYHFGDAMFDFLSPWQAERQAAFEDALLEHLCRPILEKLQRLLQAFEGEGLSDLRKWREQCLAAIENAAGTA